ncbi:hypothetical protein NDU88_004281 [Pleurodeles waltl]|uniref:Uncharacterized protein n=1 Tax=Pleurodeles waltl TaxID=8319 RepID=A0AAV7KZ23_PLEWA|nr:hypothetical protein NDU88_004281 [Pleurodeles waltl]
MRARAPECAMGKHDERVTARLTGFKHESDGRQKQPIRAVTWIQKEELDGSELGNVETGVRNLSKASDGEGSEEYDGGLPDDSRGESRSEYLRITTKTAGQSRGPGGTELKLWPQSGKSVASAGVNLQPSY